MAIPIDIGRYKAFPRGEGAEPSEADEECGRWCWMIATV